MESKDTIADHWGKGDVYALIMSALEKAGKSPDALTVEDLAPIDHFHARGFSATVDLADRLPIKPDHHILDIGCGIGGPARYIAARFQCRVSGIDITPAFVESGNKLTSLLGMENQVTIEQGDGQRLPYSDSVFDGAYTQHVTMNVADRAQFFGEAHRVLKPGAFFALTEHGLGPTGNPHYPYHGQWMAAAPIWRRHQKHAPFWRRPALRMFSSRAREVLRAGLSSAAWVTVDDTGARHKAANGFCTQVGNAHFAWFGTTASKSRLNFLHLLRAGHSDYVINTEALDYMRQRALSSPVIARLAEHPQRFFTSQVAWTAHLDRLGISALEVNPDPVMVATEGALWGSVKSHGFLPDTVIVSDDAGQFNVGPHGLCWVHAERLVHKLDTFTDEQRKAQRRTRALIWRFYRDLKTYRQHPTPQRKAALRARFDRIFTRKTGFVTLDRLLARLHANKHELLMVLDRPEIPLHTNGSENDVRCQVTKRKVSGGTRSDTGRDCRDAFLGLSKTCAKLVFAFWDYLGSRLAVPNQPEVPYLPAIVRHRCATA